MCDEPLARVREFGLLDAPRYAEMELPGSLRQSLLRQGALARLLRAQANLPDAYRLCIWDGWRPLAVQQALYDRQAAQIRRENPTLDDSEIERLTREFVARPSVSGARPFPHSTGGAADLTLISAAANAPVNMGTEFDSFGPACALTYYTALKNARPLTPDEEEAARNRVLLAEAMRAAGFVPYEGEWWHWEYGTEHWAQVTGNPRLYGPVLHLTGDQDD